MIDCDATMTMVRPTKTMTTTITVMTTVMMMMTMLGPTMMPGGDAGRWWCGKRIGAEAQAERRAAWTKVTKQNNDHDGHI